MNQKKQRGGSLEEDFFFFLLGGKEPSQGRGWHGEYVVTQLEKQSSGPAVSEVST